MLDHEKINKYEFLWISFFLMMAVAHIVLIAYSLALEGPHIVARVTRAKPAELLASGMFASPGVTYLERPARTEVVGVAQAFAFVPSEVVLEKDTETTFYLTAKDVIHGYQVQGTNINAELIPGEVATFTYNFSKPGEYRLACNQYCGIGHQNMLAKIIVVDDLEEYRQQQQVASASASSDMSEMTSMPADTTADTAADTTANTAEAGSDGVAGDLMASAAPSNWHDIGATTYSNNCASCHQGSGQGIAGAFPPLAGHTPDLVSVNGGRDYLRNLLLYGMQGQIQVEGNSYNGVMPAWAQLSDEQIASTLNYVLTEWNNEADLPADFALFSAEEIEEVRANPLNGIEVHDMRQQLGL
jgi:heme/copper-type cytochrome/quinol oxidase subunit 2